MDAAADDPAGRESRVRRTRGAAARDTRAVRGARRVVAWSVGGAVVVLGAWAWALAATSMAAVQAAEARALGPGHTADMPGEDELALVAHDARLAAMVVVVCGVLVGLSTLPRRAALVGSTGAAAAAVVANALLGPVVDGGSVALAAVALALVAGVAGVVGVLGARVGAARVPTRARPSRLPLVLAAALAAGTLPVLVLQGVTSDRYVDWVPADLATANPATALGLAVAAVGASALLARRRADVVLAVLAPLAALAVLVEPAGAAWQVREALWVPGVVLGLAAAPTLLATRRSPRGRALTATALAAAVGVMALVPHVLLVAVLPGGMLGLVVTGPAGAYVNYDGLPVVGGGLVLAALLVLLVLPQVPRRWLQPDRAAPQAARSTVAS